ncbi:MAG: LacI family DNA-binding transcriptional regulator [Clostridia bacterium]
MMEDKKRISSRDVAREAGVSQATVSYVLNNREDIKIRPETREAVLKAAEALDYHPNYIAKGMRLKRSMSIGIVTDRNVTNFYFMKTLEGIKDGVQENNYSITLLFNKHEDVQDCEYINYYNSYRIDGILFAFATVEDKIQRHMKERGIPFVIVDTTPKGTAAHQVCTDHLDKIRDAVLYFKQAGVKSIGYAGPRVDKGKDARSEALLQAAAGEGYDMDAKSLAFSVFKDEEIIRSVKGLLEGDRKPDGILAGSPKFGMLALKAALMLGKRMPGDLRLIALGSSQFFDITHPSISSIEVPLFEMGQKAAGKLFGILAGEKQEKITIVPSELVIRES